MFKKKTPENTKKEHLKKKTWKCLHGINMVKDHSITYQRGQRYIAIKMRTTKCWGKYI